MKLAQIYHHGALTAAIQENGRSIPVPNQTVASLIEQAEASGKPLADVARALASSRGAVEAEIQIPITPPEVWACGCTYAPSAEFRDGELGTREGMYAYVHNTDHRPELFEKGGPRVCVGSGEGIGIRSDSKFTAPEPELALIVNSKGEIQGYTLANDVSAWDIERENALYLPQSKIFDRCCALGPYVVTPDEIADPYELEMSCTITREGQTTFSGSCSTNKLRRKFEELVEYLLRSNTVPAGTALLTGTGIIVTEEAALKAGDVTTIEVPQIGTLSNPAVIV
jgi:2-dehydro-3-deoxy-D-arabinonate dehydratase